MSSTSSQSVTKEGVLKSTKLRHLKLKSFSKLTDILNVENRWLEVAMRLKAPDNANDLFTASDISQLQNQWKRGGSPAEAFLQHWSTTGLPAKHPTVGDLLNILLEAKLYLAADSISKELFQVPISSTNFNIETDEVLADIKNMKLKNAESKLSDQQKDTALVENTVSNSLLLEKVSCQVNVGDLKSSTDDLMNFRFEYLQEITNNFCDISVLHGGYKIGEGGFGTVYRAYVNDQWIAIKKLKNEVDKQFFTELECLRRFKHENLLPLYGFSNNGPYSCLVYLYMENGSLQERLSCLNNSPPLSWQSRIGISCGAARGINHLHTFDTQPLVHRDIKSANVLLDKNLTAKVGDFGLARIGNSGQSATAAFTSNVFGTSVYMAPEAFHGEVSVKLDTFSYGVVVLELLTGLPPYDADREEKDLVSHLEENVKDTKNIMEFQDIKAGRWDATSVISLYEISKRCVERRKRDRPTISEILPAIEKLLMCKNITKVLC